MTEPGKIQSDDSPSHANPDSRADGAGVPDSEPVASRAAAPPAQDPDDTVGTGSAIALGCVAGTLLLIVLGLAFLALLAFLN